jgi:hypothetical protein
MWVAETAESRAGQVADASAVTADPDMKIVTRFADRKVASTAQVLGLDVGDIVGDIFGDIGCLATLLATLPQMATLCQVATF